MDPFAKYLPVAKTKLDLSHINSEQGIEEFCKDYLQKKGYKVSEGNFIPEVIEKKVYPSNSTIITSTFKLPLYEIKNAPNVSYIQRYVQDNLHHQLSEEIMNAQFADMKYEDDLYNNCRIYVLKLGVFKI
jgi:hypothetical protein